VRKQFPHSYFSLFLDFCNFNRSGFRVKKHLFVQLFIGKPTSYSNCKFHSETSLARRRCHKKTKNLKTKTFTLFYSVAFRSIAANGWVFLLAGIMITGFCKYTKMNNLQKSL